MLLYFSYGDSGNITVNGVTGHPLLSSDVNDISFIAASCLITDTVYFYVDSVSIVHSDSSETSLGTTVFSSFRDSVSSGNQVGTWTPPETILVPTDALKVVLKVVTRVQTSTKIFISQQLEETLLLATEWTFSLKTSKSLFFGINYLGSITWSSPTSTSTIDGIQFPSKPDNETIGAPILLYHELLGYLDDEEEE
jgi:hypothetical protein